MSSLSFERTLPAAQYIGNFFTLGCCNLQIFLSTFL
jgi:hypothetical protein